MCCLLLWCVATSRYNKGPYGKVGFHIKILSRETLTSNSTSVHHSNLSTTGPSASSVTHLTCCHYCRPSKILKMIQSCQLWPVDVRVRSFSHIQSFCFVGVDPMFCDRLPHAGRRTWKLSVMSSK